jgi:two-component system, OmpR family, phosphate regulon response regulator PhoB
MGKKILIVDDEKVWVRMLAMSLDHEGYELEVAFDAIQATTQALRLRPDLILLDIMMPAGGGLAALKNIRTNVKTFSIPVLVLTAKGDRKTKEAVEELGVSGYFSKSMDLDELLGKIREILVK